MTVKIALFEFFVILSSSLQKLFLILLVFSALARGEPYWTGLKYDSTSSAYVWDTTEGTPLTVFISKDDFKLSYNKKTRHMAVKKTIF